MWGCPPQGFGESRRVLEGLDIVYQERNLGYADAAAGFVNRVYWDDELVVEDSNRPAMSPLAYREISHPWEAVGGPANPSLERSYAVVESG